MLYFGYLADNTDKKYKVEIITNNSTATQRQLMLADNGVIIKQESDSIFSPIKSRSCTITILSESIEADLWTAYNHGISVCVYTVNSSNVKTGVVFEGYMTPGLYSQTYVGLDEIQLEAVDCISTLKNIKYNAIGNDGAAIVSVRTLINTLLTRAGTTSNYYYPNTLTYLGGSDRKILEYISINESNFFDDDDDRTPWNCYEVLEELCKFLGWSLTRYNNLTYFVDYKNITVFNNRSMIYNQNNSSSIISGFIDNITINSNKYLGDDASISYDDVYNKIEISQNTYPYDEIISDITDNSLLDSVTKEAYLGSGGLDWTHLTYNNHFLWFKWNEEKVASAHEFKTFAHANPDTSGWTHYFYNPRTGAEINNAFFTYNAAGKRVTALKPYSNGETGLNWYMNQALNTTGCLIQKYASYKHISKLPSNLGWSTYLTFFNFNDTAGSQFNPFGYILKPVLKYTSPEEMNFSPANYSDTSWICFKGALWYQNHTTGVNIYGSEHNCLVVSPVDTVLSPDAKEYNESLVLREAGVYRTWHIKTYTRGYDTTDWGVGWPVLKCRLKIGDKYWSGGGSDPVYSPDTTHYGWTTTPSDFWIYYNNNPGANSTETFACFQWQVPAYNINYTQKVGEDCWAIPITKADECKGKLEFTIYSPSITPAQYISEMYMFPHPQMQWMRSFPIVFMKDFELKYKFTTGDAWYLESGESNTKKEDIVFTNTIDADYVNDFDDLELKINSFVDTDDMQSEISRSHVLLSRGYLDKVKHIDISNPINGQYQERNLLNLYYDHYNTQKLIYDATLKDNYTPYSMFNITANGLTNKKYILDSYEWNLGSRENKVKLIQY